jgi:hypothetical protein
MEPVNFGKYNSIDWNVHALNSSYQITCKTQNQTLAHALHIKYEGNTTEDRKILLEDSTASCPSGSRGCIKIIFHGQQAELSRQNIKKADAAIHEMLNPAGDTEEIQLEAEDIYDAS